MQKYMVITQVQGIMYLTTVTAPSALTAEHLVLDVAICGRHEYGVAGAIAYDARAMKTDAFIGAALAATPIDFLALVGIIERNNERIRKLDAAEELREIEVQMDALRKRMEAAQNILDT